VSSSLFYQPTMLALPPEVRALAIDLRGFGDSETLPVDATRGVRDFSDDVASVIDALGLTRVHLVGWSMGGGVVLQLLLDRPELVASVALESPVSPYGFGGTAGPDGRRLDTDGAGTGGGAANPDFVQRLADGDTGDESPTSPRTVYRTAYVKDPARVEHEDLWVASMLTTRTGVGNYPGDSVPSERWPGFAAGPHGVLNTLAPTHFDVSGIVDLATKPPILWIHGVDDAIVSDGSFFDLNQLGKAGIIPGWPGEEVAPPQPMVAQTRAVLARYRDAGGVVRELELADCGHAPHLDQPAAFDGALAEHVRAAS
jgi:pimeloyl-ACP methyl ester carboxylesterase